MDVGALIIGIVFIISFYFVPTIIAVKRDHTNMASLFALNLLGGWTFIGWLAALVWSLGEANKVVIESPKKPEAKKPLSPKPETNDTKECQFCAETIKAKAVYCKHCGKDLEEAAA